MARYIIRRLLVSIPVIFAIILATFTLVHALPGGPFDTVGEKSMPEQMRRIMERRYGLDKPLYEQFFLYIKNLLSGDLGPMMTLRSQDVNDIVAETFPVSIQLGMMAVILGFVIGIPAGVIAALGRNTIVDYSATFVAVAGVSIPSMVLGPVLILIFGVSLGWFPIAFWGSEPPFVLGLLPKPTPEFWHHAALPVAPRLHLQTKPGHRIPLRPGAANLNFSNCPIRYGKSFGESRESCDTLESTY